MGELDGKSSRLLPLLCLQKPLGRIISGIWSFVVFVGLGLINGLTPNDTMWRRLFGSTLAQAMVCCLTAPSHHLNQRWFLIKDVLWHVHPRAISQRLLKQLVCIMSLTNTLLKLVTSPMANELTNFGIVASTCVKTDLPNPSPPVWRLHDAGNQKHTQIKFDSDYQTLYSSKYILKCCLCNGGSFCDSMC